MGGQRNTESNKLMDIEKIYWSFMFFMGLAIFALITSIISCAGPLQNQPPPPTVCDPFNLTITDKAMDPCELEFWEDEELARRGR